VSIEATKAPAFDMDQFRALTEPIKHYTCAFDDPSKNVPPAPPSDAPLILRNLHTRLLNFVELLYLHKEMVDKAEQNMLTEYFVCQRVMLLTSCGRVAHPTPGVEDLVFNAVRTLKAAFAHLRSLTLQMMHSRNLANECHTLYENELKAVYAKPVPVPAPPTQTEGTDPVAAVTSALENARIKRRNDVSVTVLQSTATSCVQSVTRSLFSTPPLSPVSVETPGDPTPPKRSKTEQINLLFGS